MGINVKQVLNATAMELPIFCGGFSRVGVNLAGTWTGTATFLASFDGVNFASVQVTPFASGTKVSSATVNGSWFFDVKNYIAFKVVFTRTTGSLVVNLAAAADASWQDAFLLPNARFLNSVASGATNTLTVAAQTNRAWRLRTLQLAIDTTATWATQPVLQIKDGSTLLWGLDHPTAAGLYNIPLPTDPLTPGAGGGGLVNTPGNTLVIAVASGGGSVKTNINAEVLAA
jgi:hypothetical protein